MPSQAPSRKPSRTSGPKPGATYSARTSRVSFSRENSKTNLKKPSRTSGGPPSTSAGSSKKSNDTKKNMDIVPCGQTVTIPPQLPDILKQYVKAAMRTQPPELLRWSGAYFRAMANGEILPVKDKLEYPLRESPDGLTPGLLRVIDAQLGGKSGQKIAGSEVLKRWRGLGLSQDSLTAILQKAQMADGGPIDWDKLMAVMASTIGQNLGDTMGIFCNVLTDQPEGMDPVINYSVWFNAYVYLARLNGVSAEKIQAVNAYLQGVTKKNAGLINPNDFKSGKCPPLE